MQKESVRSIVKYALFNNNFYRDKYTSNAATKFEELDILEKTDMQEKMSVSDEYKKFPGNTRLFEQHTTGTTGKCIKIFWDRNDYLKSMMPAVYFRKKYYNVSPQEHYLTFFSTLYVNNKIHEENEYLKRNNNLAINKQIVPLLNEKKYITEICAFEPTWMIIQPSLLMILDDLNLEWMYRLKYIETTGEHLFEGQRKYFAEKYGVTIANHYGAAETNYIALECPYGNKHVVEDNVFIELDNIDKNTGVGEVVVTNLKNKAMPIIKYRLGDNIKINDTLCKCGCKSMVIDVVHGRTIDHIITKNREKISWYPLFNAVENVNEQLGYPIKEVRIIQENESLIIFYVELFDKFKSWEESINKRLLSHVKKLKNLDGFLFEIKRKVNNFEVDTNHKQKVFERKFI